MKSRFLTWVEYIPIRIILFFLNLIPYGLSVKIGSFLGRLIYYIPSLKKTVYNGLNIAFKNEKSSNEIKALAKQVFRNFGKLCFEIMKILKMKPKKILKYMKFENEKEFLEDFNKERGMILICCHLGNWEILGAGWTMKGIKSDVIVRPLDNVLLDKYVEGMRERFGMKVIPRKDVAKKGIRTLKNKKALTFLMDQNTVKNMVFVPFFGKLASTVTGPAIFARKFKCPVGIAYGVRKSDKLHILHYKRIQIDYSIKDRKEFIKYHTELFTKEIEKVIRENPEQWLWLHPRWKTRP